MAVTINGQENWFNKDVQIYGCLYLRNPSCGITFNAPNGDTYNINVTNAGIGIAGGGGTATLGRLNLSGSGGLGGSIDLTAPDGDVYRIEATNNGIDFTIPDDGVNLDVSVRNVNATGVVTATDGFSRVGGGSTQFLMADGSVSTRFISTDSAAPASGVGTDGDTYLIVSC